ncbi:MAG TPA: hypothetical protein DCE71_05200 [Parachlamydiales bacterium]|nr:hypothetical protein [Parachlamydiales bacterium]
MASICSVSSHWFRSIGDHLARDLEARGDHLCLAVEEAIPATGDLFIGLALGFYSFATLGLRTDAAGLSGHHLFEVRKVVSLPYIHILLTLNPGAAVPSLSSEDLWGGGLLRDMRLAADQSSQEDNFFKRHIAARAQYGLYGISALALRSIQGVLGIIAAFFSLCTLGHSRFLNRVAYHGLEFPLVLRDIFYASTKCIHPFA